MTKPALMNQDNIRHIKREIAVCEEDVLDIPPLRHINSAMVLRMLMRWTLRNCLTFCSMAALMVQCMFIVDVNVALRLKWRSYRCGIVYDQRFLSLFSFLLLSFYQKWLHRPSMPFIDRMITPNVLPRRIKAHTFCLATLRYRHISGND